MGSDSFTPRGAPLSPGSSLLLATVSWADGVTTQVNVANLERQPGNPTREA
ncbi:MAG: hypothetical protein RLZZ206_4050 [Cyanobacteriota bacterium]|jgi:hypothetical protein